MRKLEVGNCTLWNCDCMDGMKKIQDKYFDLAIVDPPYGINASNYSRGGTKGGKSKARCAIYTKKDWDKSTPDQSYFNELFRISKNQIIWGANYFIEKIQRSSNCWIVWDKDNGENSYADCELAWTNFSTAVRKYRYRWHGMLQENMKNKEDRIHPTQKPVALYRWILEKYAKKGDRIIDTHVGSASSFLACIQYGCEITGFEISSCFKCRINEEIDFKPLVELSDDGMFSMRCPQCGINTEYHNNLWWALTEWESIQKNAKKESDNEKRRIKIMELEKQIEKLKGEIDE